MRRLLVFLGGQSSLGEEGTSEWAPPSTLTSNKLALTHGIDVEIDLRISKDKHIVVFHDATVDRRTDGTGSIADKMLKELKQLDAGSWFHPKFKGLKILTFQEVLTLFKEDKERVIDAHLKETMSGYEEKAVKMVESYQMVDRVQFHSYSHSPSLVKTVRFAHRRLRLTGATLFLVSLSMFYLQANLPQFGVRLRLSLRQPLLRAYPGVRT